MGAGAGALRLLASVPASAQDCSDATPWINEFDYDSADGGINNDHDEFVEVAAPAGADLGGIRFLAVEGYSGFLSLPCLSGLGVTTGNSYFDVAIPAGTVPSSSQAGKYPRSWPPRESKKLRNPLQLLLTDSYDIPSSEIPRDVTQ